MVLTRFLKSKERCYEPVESTWDPTEVFFGELSLKKTGMLQSYETISNSLALITLRVDRDFETISGCGVLSSDQDLLY